MARKEEKESKETMRIQKTVGREGGSFTSRPTMSRGLSTGGPFRFMRRFSEEMDRLFEGFGFGGLRQPRSDWSTHGSEWSPHIDIFERNNQVVVRADLPGMSKDDIAIEVHDNTITIQGERKQKHEESQSGYSRSECSYGNFFRSIPLPEGADAEHIKACFSNGVLEVTMPAPKHQLDRHIEVQETAAGEGTMSKE